MTIGAGGGADGVERRGAAVGRTGSGFSFFASLTGLSSRVAGAAALSLVEVSAGMAAGEGFVFCVFSVGPEHDAATSIIERARP